MKTHHDVDLVMIIKASRLEKNLRLFEKGLITPAEVAQAFLHELAVQGGANELEGVLRQLPGEAAHHLSQLLARIERLGFVWECFLIGGSERFDSPEFRALIERLRRALGG